MTTSAIRTVCAWLQISAATACVLFFAATIACGAATPAGAITFVGTDGNIYYCDAKCAKPKCITCKAPAMRVKGDDYIVPIAYGDAQFRPEAPPEEHPGERPGNSTEYGLPTFSPDGKRLAYWSEGRSERIIYMRWLADGQHLSFLLGEPLGLSLMLAEIKESSPVRIVTTGMPLYFDWGATAGELAAHTLALNSDRPEEV